MAVALWELNFADYFGLGLGVISLAISLGIYHLQRNAEKSIRRLRKEHIESRLLTLLTSLEDAARDLAYLNIKLDSLPSLEESNTTKLLQQMSLWRLGSSQSNITNALYPIRLDIPVNLADNIESTVRLLSEFDNDDLEKAWGIGDPDSWFNDLDRLTIKVNVMIEEIREYLKFLK